MIDGTPEIVLHALDPDKDFIHVPLIPWPWPPTPQAAGETCSELLAPAPHGFVGDDGASLSQEQLNIPQAEAEHVIEPDGVADDLGWEPVAIVRIGGGSYRQSHPPPSRRPDPVIVTIPLLAHLSPLGWEHVNSQVIISGQHWSRPRKAVTDCDRSGLHPKASKSGLMFATCPPMCTSRTFRYFRPTAGEPELRLLPSRLWLIGLGHLGQAYLGALGLLPYADAAKVGLGVAGR